MADDVDFRHTAGAEVNRRRKVAVVASWCWQRGITAADLDRCSRGHLVAIAGQARVSPPGEGSTTWHHVKVALERMAAWAAAHPGDPRAGQPYLGLGAQWVPLRPVSPVACVLCASGEHGPGHHDR